MKPLQKMERMHPWKVKTSQFKDSGHSIHYTEQYIYCQWTSPIVTVLYTGQLQYRLSVDPTRRQLCVSVSVSVCVCEYICVCVCVFHLNVL